MDVAQLNKISEYEWEIKQTGKMNVPGRIFASQALVEEMGDKVKEQIQNVAQLPGIQKSAMAMPDAHWGYGFPIGGVAAFDPEEEGVICMGGVGYDISCGVRTLKTNLTLEEIQPYLKPLADELFKTVPAGLGVHGKIKLDEKQLDEVLLNGAEWVIEKGYGLEEDLEYTEEKGKMEGADPTKVSYKAKKRQFKEVGTLGSGNHYLEVQYIDEIYNEKIAKMYGLEKNQIVISLHCGSRALGHQIGVDYTKTLTEASQKYNLNLPDKELAAAPINSPEGQDYFAAMKAGVNTALANRQVIGHLARTAFEKIIPNSEVKMFYDISHNTCKEEEHIIGNKKKKLFVHRKGATRAFGPGRKELPKAYMQAGQPVLIGGTMGTSSFILAGTEEGTEKTFGSACHGAGRGMSRKQAKKQFYGENIISNLKQQHKIIVKAHSAAGVAEEAPGAYKNVEEVVNSVHYAGLAKKIIRLKPVINIKG